MRVGQTGFLVLALLLAACGQQPDSKPAKSASPPVAVQVPASPASSAKATPMSGVEASPWLAHLASYPEREVSASASMVVQFSHPVVHENQVGKPAKGAFRTSPELPLSATFTATNTLEIRPQEPLPQGKRFTLMLYPQALDGVDDGFAPWQAELMVMRQSLRVRVDSLAPAGEDQMLLTGRVETSDVADAGQVEQVVTAKQDGQPLAIVWQHDAGGREHGFSVAGIRRDAHSSPVALDWSGNSLGLDSRGGQDYPVPASPKAFEVTLVRAVSDPKPHINVQFSQSLDGTQNLAGLVTLDGKDATVRINGSSLDVYPDDKIKDGKVTLVVNPGIKSNKGVRLTASLERELALVVNKPGVRFVGAGSILPQGKVLSVPFEAVGAKAVKVQAFEIYENNIPAYLKSHALDSGSFDNGSGRWLWQKTLSLPPDSDDGWQRYRLDLTELMAKHPRGLVLLVLNLDAETRANQCPDKQPTHKVSLPTSYEGPGNEVSSSDYYRDQGYLKWSERDDPCTDAYYVHNRQVTSSSRAFVASNLGLIAKRGENDALLVFASWLDQNTPARGVKVTAYNYQNQQVGTGSTDAKGDAVLTVTGTPFYLVAEKGDQKGYLKLARNQALPTNQFDTSGELVRDGLKGAFYGERDIWRPGDDIHLTFVLDDADKRLPANYPLTLDFINPRGEKVSSYTNSQPVGNFYAFTLATDEAAPTGNWRALVRVGKRTFDTQLRIEAIKPNRLKMELNTPAQLQADSDNAVTLVSQWLNGAIADKLKADVKVRLLNRTARFAGLDGFDFNDPTRTLEADPFTAFDGQLDEKGQANFALKLPAITPPGMASAVLTTRVFENSGDYSTQIRSFSVMPYEHWVGLQVPKGTGWGNSLARDRDSEIGLLTVDSDGKPEANRKLTLSVYEIGWRWWWDSYASDSLANFVNAPHTYRLKQESLVTDQNGRAQWTLHGQDYDWGRYLIRVCQDEGKQCAAKTVYLGWGGERSVGGDAATRLSLSSDKTRYQVGETAHVKVPAAGGGRLLVSLESGNKILNYHWVDVPAGQDSQMLDIPVTADMTPNVYVSVMLLQPHTERDNDRPIRLYGVTPLLVTDPATHLAPVIDVPTQVRPQSHLSVSVSEKDGKPMVYTLAVVDEGLLGLTNFRTPSLHDDFYRREALGVRTWDLYDQVVGAYGGDLDRLLAVGGSDAGEGGQEKDSRRFPPVVRFLGPFQLNANETQTRTVELPAYMGQVRVMVVAGDGRAFGSADKDVTVTQPLTLLSTLPRVLGPGEQLLLPVTVFAAADQNGKVPAQVSVSADAQPPLQVVQKEAQLSFTQAGNQIAMLKLAVGNGIGTADVNVHARAGEHQADETIHMPVRAPNPPATRQQGGLLNPGGSWKHAFAPLGVDGTNQAWLTVSRLPDMGLQKRLDYLIQYPHGCIEQTTSTIFPQLYLGQLVNLDDAEKQRIQRNIDAAIQRYRRFQLASGGFSYWPNGGSEHDWGSSYAGHFLVEAKRAGYAVPSNLIDNWKGYQQRAARDLGSRPWSWSLQAYRLYTLALAGSPEVGAMNRLRELLLGEAQKQKNSPDGSYLNSRWLLAAAYQQMGLNDVARELVPQQISADYHNYWYYSFGSRLRDDAIAMQVLAATGDSNGAWQLVKTIADRLASDQWYSTQSLAWALMSMAKIGGSADADDKNFSFRWRDGKGDWQQVDSQAAVFRQTLEQADQPRQLELDSASEQPLFVAVTTRGTPPPGGEQAESSGLSLQVRFENLAGQPIDPAKLKQGTDFQAIITVKNTSGRWLPHVALTQIMPSGWQITESPREGNSQQEAYDYRDLRDDRVMTYFDLNYRNSRTYTVSLNASFAGRFYLPGWHVAAMYNETVQARSAGEWVEVVR